MNSRIEQIAQRASKKIVTRQWDEETHCFGPDLETYELDRNLFAKLLLEDCCKLIEQVGLENLDFDIARTYTRAIKNRFDLVDNYPFG